MKTISINSPKHGIKKVLVDDQDYAALIKYNWSIVKLGKTFYALRSTYKNGKESSVRMHRQILNPTSLNIWVDHIDHNGLNNQRNNLREVNAQQSNQNKRSFESSSSKFVGVCWHKKDKKWQAAITINKKQIHLGQFDNDIDAAKARDAAALKLFGEFANLNFK